MCAPGSRISIGGGTSSKKLLSAAGSKLASGARVTGELLTSAGDGARQIMKQAGAVLPKFTGASEACTSQPQPLLTNQERERENYAEKGENPFLHMLKKWALT